MSTPPMIFPLELRYGSVTHIPGPTFQGLVIKKRKPLSLMVRVQGRFFKKVQKVRQKTVQK